MSKAFYPGSFDPVTMGHIDIMERAYHLFDELVVAVSKNITKKCMFTVQERVEMIQKSTPHLPGLKVEICEGLIADYAQQIGAQVIIRGLRAVSDFEIELKTALMNKHLNPEIETVFLMPKAEYLFLNSSLVREVSYFGGNIRDFVPTYVVECLGKKYNEIKEK
jgi:pantetheine-phosphate adenylyltransferase